jgi:hypothetical protein
MLVAIDAFHTATGEGKGVGGTAKALVATLIATMADLEASHLPIRLSPSFPGLYLSEDSLTRPEAQRAWHLWDALAGELLVMMTEIETYFPQADYCAALPGKVGEVIERLSKEDDIRVIDLRKLDSFVSKNKLALLDGANDFHTAVHRVKTIVSEAVTVLETLRSPEKLKRLQGLAIAAARMEVFDPILVLERFEPEVRDFLADVK